MMPNMGRLPASGSTSIVVDADPTDVWAVVCDPTRVGEWSHETRAAAWESPATEAAVGAEFVATNMLGRLRWRRRNEILEFDPPHTITWRTVPSRLYNDSTRWTLRVEPVDGRTRLTQEFEVLALNPVMERLFYLFISKHRDRSDALRSDLEQIGALAERSSTRGIVG
ncbi:MAG: SRPBCC family protein [Ilumatobacteraceae bacterium]